MTHPRTLIREAAVAALLDNTIAEDRVWPNRPNPVTQQANARAGRTEFPAIIVYTTSESSVVFNEAPREYRRTVEMIVECAKHIDAGTELDEQLDDFARVVERLLLNDDTLDGTCADLRMVSTSMGIVDNGQKLLGVVALTVEADYYEFFPGDDKVAGLDDLRTVAGRYSLSGEQAQADQAPETIRLDMQVVRIRVLADGETIEIQLSEAITLEDEEGAFDLLLGWGVEVDEAVVVPTAAEADGDVLRLTVPTVYGGQLVRVSYDAEAGEVAGEDFALPTFTDRAAANFSEQSAPPAPSGGYPLDDDGTLAGGFGYTHAPANPPEYHVIEYTYTGAADSGAALALPAQALTDDAITVGAGKKLYFEAVYELLPAGDFAAVNIVGLPVSGGSPAGFPVAVGLDRFSGTAQVGGSPFTDQNTVASLAGYRVGLLFDGDTGDVTAYSSDGELVGTGAFTPGVGVAMYVFISDEGDTPAGQTLRLRFVPNAADVVLPGIIPGFPSGVTDHAGEVIS